MLKLCFVGGIILEKVGQRWRINMGKRFIECGQLICALQGHSLSRGDYNCGKSF